MTTWYMPAGPLIGPAPASMASATRPTGPLGGTATLTQSTLAGADAGKSTSLVNTTTPLGASGYRNTLLGPSGNAAYAPLVDGHNKIYWPETRGGKTPGMGVDGYQSGLPTSLVTASFMVSSPFGNASARRLFDTATAPLWPLTKGHVEPWPGVTGPMDSFTGAVNSPFINYGPLGGAITLNQNTLPGYDPSLPAMRQGGLSLQWSGPYQPGNENWMLGPTGNPAYAPVVDDRCKPVWPETRGNKIPGMVVLGFATGNQPTSIYAGEIVQGPFGNKSYIYEHDKTTPLWPITFGHTAPWMGVLGFMAFGPTVTPTLNQNKLIGAESILPVMRQYKGSLEFSGPVFKPYGQWLSFTGPGSFKAPPVAPSGNGMFAYFNNRVI